jgi:hypothetical protein
MCESGESGESGTPGRLIEYEEAATSNIALAQVYLVCRLAPPAAF